MNTPTNVSRPEGEAKLRADLAQIAGAATEIEAEDEALLPMVVGVALQGRDIAEAFPDYFRKLLAQPGLREAFLDALSALEELPAGLTKKLRQEVEQWERADQPQIENLPAKRLRLTWQQSIAQLQAIFFPATPGVIFRSDELLDDDVAVPILNAQTRLGVQAVNLSLYVIQNLDAAELLQPVARITLKSPAGEAIPFPPGARLHLRWGSYQAEAAIAGPRVLLAPLPWIAVLDDAGAQVRADLTFSLETPAPP